MKPMFFKVALLALAAFASWTLLSGCGELSAENAKVISVSEKELTIEHKPGEAPMTHEVAENAKVSLDGKPAKLNDLKPGDEVQVTTEKRGEKVVAVEIEAERAGQKPAPGAPGGPGELIPPPTLQPGQPATDKPATDKPAADKPATDKPAADKPATDQPAKDKPAIEKLKKLLPERESSPPADEKPSSSSEDEPMEMNP